MGSAQDLGSEAAALGVNRLEHIQRLHGAVARLLFSEGHDFSNPGRHKDSFPQPVFARAERAANFSVNFGRVDTFATQSLANRTIGLLEQCDEQMFDSDVIVVMITALLFGSAQHAPRG